MNAIIFSKDRPAQLELLLRSMEHFAPKIYEEVTVMVNNEGQYLRVKELHPYVRFISDGMRGSFKHTLVYEVNIRERITVFFVDDDCFVHDFNFNKAEEALKDPGVLCHSIRLNMYMDYCHSRDIFVQSPHSLIWDWHNFDGDFGYPMSLEGHFFRTDDIYRLLEQGVYNNPNTLEAWLAAHPITLNMITCGKHNSIVGNPHNLVQTTYKNRHSGGDLDKINKEFNEGKIISIDPYLCHHNAPHVPIEIKMI